MVPTSFVKDGPKLGVLAMNTRPLPKRASLGNRCRKTARRTAKWGFHRCSVKKCRISGQKCSFLARNPFFRKSSNFFVTIMTGHQKDNTLVLTPLHGGPRGGRRGPFLARKSAFLYATFMKSPFFGVRLTRLNGIISPPYPEVTLDTFGILVCGRLVARRPFFGPNCPKQPFLGQKMMFFGQKSIFVDIVHFFLVPS